MGESGNTKEKTEVKKTLGNAFLKVKKTAKEKKILVGIIITAVVIALIATVVINAKKGNYEVLFPGMSQEENAEVYAVLQSRDVPVKRNSDGEVMVQSNKAGDIMLDMSMLGYPKTTLPFDIFSDNTGFTTTEFEKKQYLLLNLQDRMERTLKEMSGIKNAIVTLNVPDDNTYVWDEEDSSSTGSVSISMMPGNELSEEKVSAIKNLVSDSVPRLLPEHVTVVNADTMEEYSSGESVSEGLNGVDRLDFETKVEKKLAEKIGNVLSLGYSKDQFRVSATVVIDYDKMITEDFKYVPEADGDGIVQHSEASGTTDGTGGTAGGVAGEENNTDVPDYTADNGDGTTAGAGQDYYRSMDYVISYIKKQIEKDNVKLQKATVAIAVNDNNLTNAKRQQIIDSASKAANIEPEDIVVTGFEKTQNKVTQETAGALDGLWASIDPKILFGVGGAVVVLLILLGIFIHRRKKQAEEEEDAVFATEEMDTAEILERAEKGAVESFIKPERPKREKSPSEEVKTFAKANPEIIAAMISSWLKEDE